MTESIEKLRRYTAFWQAACAEWSKRAIEAEAERDEWKAKYLAAVNDAEDYKALWMRSREGLGSGDCGPCYSCAKLAELIAENSALRVKCDEHDEAERNWERKFNEAMGKEYEMRQQLVKELDELRAGEGAKVELNELEAKPMIDKCADQAVDATRYALGATDAEWSQEQLENANPALANALKAHVKPDPLKQLLDDLMGDAASVPIWTGGHTCAARLDELPGGDVE